MGRLSSLLEMEVLRLFRFPVLELIVIAATFFAFRSILSFDVQGLSLFSLSENIDSTWLGGLLNRFTKGIILKQICPFLSSYTYIALIYAALTSMIAGDMSSGYMTLLLSQPFKRSEIFAVRVGLTFLIPLAIYMSASSASVLIVGGLGTFVADPSLTLVCYGIAFASFLYVFSICLSLTLVTKETVPSFISSLLFLYGIDYAIGALGDNPIRILIPNAAFLDLWQALGSSRASLPWLSLLTPLAISIGLVALCYVYLTRRLEV
jgi:ABC-type transport system involved in multi-copper enzyme maturation permease subunit